MTTKFCRICRAPTVDQSIFCRQHRNQAVLFASSFGTDDENKNEASKEERSEPLTAIRPDDGQTRLGSEFDDKLRLAVETMLKHLPPATSERVAVPEIVFYFLQDKMLCRTFWGFLRPESTWQPTPEQQRIEFLRRAFLEPGVVTQKWSEWFTAKREQLKNGSIFSLVGELRLHENLLILYERVTEQQTQVLDRLKGVGDHFVAES